MEEKKEIITFRLEKPKEEWEKVLDKGYIKLTEEEIAFFKETLKKITDKEYWKEMEKELDDFKFRKRSLK